MNKYTFSFNPNVDKRCNCSYSLYKHSLDLINLDLNKHTPFIYFAHIQDLDLICDQYKKKSRSIKISKKKFRFLQTNVCFCNPSITKTENEKNIFFSTAHRQAEREKKKKPLKPPLLSQERVFFTIPLFLSRLNYTHKWHQSNTIKTWNLLHQGCLLNQWNLILNKGC